jgi:hypothetical protein
MGFASSNLSAIMTVEKFNFTHTLSKDPLFYDYASVAVASMRLQSDH